MPDSHVAIKKSAVRIALFPFNALNYLKLSLYCISLLLIAVSFSACSVTRNHTGKAVHPGNSADIDYTLIYMIHGDADYLYHNAEGKALEADEQVLAEAKRLARQAKSGEVFIYHLRPERKILWLFPKKDRRIYYYRNGNLEFETAYSPEPGSGVFSQESDLYSRLKDTENGNREVRNLFLYFGHEIPYGSGAGYHQSFPKVPVHTGNFAEGIKSFTKNRQGFFELTLLSTCNNGSPDMVHALAPLTENLLASPQNLHLSHMRTRKLSLLESNPDIKTEALVRELATDTYDYLDTFLQTVITLTHFDMEEVKRYSLQADSLYQHYLSENKAGKPGSDNTDCKDLSIFKNEPDFSRGVTTWYRAPKFGIRADKKQHSGWGCKPGNSQN